MRVSGSIRFAAIAILAGCSGLQSPIVLRQAQDDRAQVRIPYWQAARSARAACSGSRVGRAQCDVLIETNQVHSMYAGWSAKDLEAAYDLPITKGKGQSVYVVDAFDNPDVASDFAAYRKGMGLPAGATDGATSKRPKKRP
jgi:hypothetical protein